MDKNRELAKNTAIITIGRLSTQFISFFLLPLYTAVLTKEEYGNVDLINTYAQLVLPIVLLQTDQALLRFLLMDRNKNEHVAECISTSFFFILFQVILFSCIYSVSTLFYYNTLGIYLYMNVIAMTISSMLLQCSRGFGDNVTYSISSFICSVVTILCNLFFILGLSMRAEGMLLATVIGNVLASIYIWVRKDIIKFVKVKSFNKKLLRDMIKYAWPLVPNALIWWVVNASDRSIVLLYLGASANGLLAVSHKFPSLIMTLYNIFHLSWTESAALHLNEVDKDDFFSSVFDVAFRFFASASLIVIAMMPFVFDFFVNTSFRDSYNQIPIYMMASFFNIIVGLYSVVYLAFLKTKEIAKTSLLAGVINVLVDLLLIRHMGLYAASISSAVAFGIMALYRSFDSKKYIKQRFDYRLLIATSIMFIISLLSYYSELFISKIIVLIGVLVFALITNISNWNKIISFIRSKKTGDSEKPY